MEEQLRAAWCDVLGLEESDIDSDSDFFALGGDSVMALRLTSAAQDRNISLDAEMIYNHSVCMDMARVCCHHPLQPQNASETATSMRADENVIEACAQACGVARDLIEDVFTSTVTQDVIFHSHHSTGAMLLQTVFEIGSELDLDRLRRTWQLLRDKNQFLRTRLVKHGDRIFQVVVNDEIHWRSSSCDLAVYTADDMSTRVRSGDPLFRYAIVDEECGGKKFFVWTCHHAGFDGWTRCLIFNKLQEGFDDMTRFENESQGPSYKSFVQWKHSHEEKKSVEAMAFWKKYLGDGYENPKGVNYPSPGYVPLSTSHTSRMLKMKPTSTKSSSFTASTLGHAAWALAIASIWHSKEKDVLFATIKMGRQMTRDEPLDRAESTMGPMLTVVPVRVALLNNKDMPIRDFLSQMQHELISTIPYEHEGWEAIVHYLGTEAILPGGYLNWHPAGSDIFSRVLKQQHHCETPDYDDDNGGGGGDYYLQPRKDLSVDFTTNLPSC